MPGRRRKQDEVTAMLENPDVLGTQGDGDDDDDDTSGLNNPDVTTFSEPPLLSARSQASDMFGASADTFGRPTSPKLYASTGQFPTAVQYRVWRMENGVPVALGAIDAEATEEDLVAQFYDAMPRKGEGRVQLRLRPIDMRGQELNKEFSMLISEHHEALKRIKERKLREQEEERGMNPGYGRNGGDVIVNPGGGNDGGAFEEMGRVFEQVLETGERRTELLQRQLEEERERLRGEERQRIEERVKLAENATNTVQSMTERVMKSEQIRAAEALQAERLRAEESGKSSQQNNQMLLSTLTSVFQQQQEAARQHAERQREADKAKADQDREFFDRQRKESEDRRRDEIERLRLEMHKKEENEKAERERERLKIQDERERFRLELLEKQRVDALFMQKREEAEKLDRERERIKYTEERERLRLELEEKRRLDQIVWEQRRETDKAEREAKDKREREEREAKDKRDREDRETREKRDREEREERERKFDREKLEWERKETIRREELAREAQLRQDAYLREELRRKEELALQQKAIETAAQRDKEHAERMMESARLEREQQREAALAREKLEIQARESVEKERQRQYELQLKEMQLQKERDREDRESKDKRDREHAERMASMHKAQQMPGLGGLTDLLGMETPELLERIFGGAGSGPPGEGGSGWADAIPKMLGSLADVAGKVINAKQVEARTIGRRPQPQLTGPQVIMPPSLQGPPQQQEAPRFQQNEGKQQPVVLGQVAGQPQPAPAEVAPAPDLPVDTVAKAKAAGLNLLVQKKARKALRSLVETLEKSSEDQWEGLAFSAFMGEPDALEYVKAVGLGAALIEAKASRELAVKVVAMVQERQKKDTEVAAEEPAVEVAAEVATPVAPTAEVSDAS